MQAIEINPNVLNAYKLNMVCFQRKESGTSPVRRNVAAGGFPCDTLPLHSSENLRHLFPTRYECKRTLRHAKCNNVMEINPLLKRRFYSFPVSVNKALIHPGPQLLTFTRKHTKHAGHNTWDTAAP